MSRSDSNVHNKPDFCVKRKNFTFFSLPPQKKENFIPNYSIFNSVSSKYKTSNSAYNSNANKSSNNNTIIKIKYNNIKNNIYFLLGDWCIFFEII